MDYYVNTNGFRRETDLTTGASLRDDHYGDRDDWVANGSVGFSQQIIEDRLRGSNVGLRLRY